MSAAKQTSEPLTGWNQIFYSSRLSVLVLLLLFGSCLLLTGLPQQQSVSFYLEQYGPVMGRLITLAGLDTILQTPHQAAWFYVLLVLMACNLGGLWRLFISVKLSFSLLLILALTSILGTVIIQGQRPAWYLAAYGEGWGQLVLALGLGDTYHTPWFLLLLSALAVNLVACSLDRLPRTLQTMRKSPGEQAARSRPAEHSFTLAGEPQDKLEAAQSLLGKVVGPAYLLQQEDNATLFAQRGAASRLGVYLVHLSVLVVFAGAILGNALGFSGQVNIAQGETVKAITLDQGQPKVLGFTVRLDKFNITYYPGGNMPSEYRSDVTFFKDGRPAGQAVIRVNEPATFEGIDFYQSAYGERPSSLTANYTRQGQVHKVRLLHHQWSDLPGGGQAGLIDLKPEVDMGGMYQGPVARVAYQAPGQEPVSLTAFKAGAAMPNRGPVKFEIIEWESLPYTGLQVKYDPGVWFIWVGCSLMVLGFLVTFYTSHRKVWLRLAPAGQGRTRVEIAGSANKNRPGLNRLLERLAQRAKETLEAAE